MCVLEIIWVNALLMTITVCFIEIIGACSIFASLGKSKCKSWRKVFIWHCLQRDTVR